MKTVDWKGIHTLWMTLWDHLENFVYIFDVDEVHGALISAGNPTKHPFWEKFADALWTLVKVPQLDAASSKRFRTMFAVPAESTEDWFDDTKIDVELGLAKEFLPHQGPVPGGTNCIRSFMSGDDFNLFVDLSKRFPRHIKTPFAEASMYPPTLIQKFIEESDEYGQNAKTIVDPRAHNVFCVQGKRCPRILVTVYKKLNTWHMRQVGVGNSLRGTQVYFFS
jgi:hypothetical protein